MGMRIESAVIARRPQAAEAISRRIPRRIEIASARVRASQ
jgi:hypothetical protein